MSASQQWLSIWLTSIFLAICFVSAQVEDKFIFHGFNGANLITDGIAKVLPNGLLQLTNTSEAKIGHAFYQFPFQFGPFNFSTTFVIAIVPDGISNRPGHGMAFVISSSTNFSNAEDNHYLGIFDNTNIRNHLLAIEFDTVRDKEVGDIDANHVGVDVNNLVSADSKPASYFSDEEGKKINLTLSGGDRIQVWIDYDASRMLLNVTIAPLTTQRPTVPLISKVVNASDVFLDSMFVGFSASTGVAASSHYVHGWSFNKNGKAQDLETPKPPLPSLPPPPLPSLPPPPPPPPSPAAPKTPRKLKIIIPVSLVMVLVLFAGVYLYRNMKFREVLESWEREYSPQRYSYKKLYKATQGFNDKELLGKGGFGQVYRGKLPSKEEIAVKRIAHDSKQGMQEFVTEIVSMKRLRHKNLVQLLGYCRRKGELLLVYEYMPNKSLEKLLYSHDPDQTLDWSQRFHIIKGIVAALLYLHEEWEQVVLHRDIKASNVLLDAALNGRLADFGLAKFHDHGNDAQATRLVGTIGHMAPELWRSGIPTKGTDVYAFGAFMLELACGKKPIESPGLPDEVVLVESVIQCWKMGDLLGAADPKLEDTYVAEEVELVLKLGILCHSVSNKRPSVRQLMQYLDGTAKFVDFELDEAGITVSGRKHEASDTIAAFASSSHSICTNESILMTGR